MSYAFSDMQSKLSSLLGDSNTGTDDQFPLASRKKEINRGEMQFCLDSHCVREKATGTISSAQIALPSDCLQIHVLIVNNYVVTKDREISIEDWERFYNYNGSIPIYYISEESGVRYMKLLGAPNGLAYSLYYFKKPSTELSVDSDTSILPEEFREGAVYYAASELLSQIGKNAIADIYYQRYLAIVREAMKYAEDLYMTKTYARPDTNLLMGSNDMVGGGFDYSYGVW
jgi:hypothetical protein